MIAGAMLTWAAAQHGELPSLVFKDRSFSHADVEARSNRFANALIGLGLAPGDRIAVLLENSVESVDSVFGAEKAALTYVALNARHTLAEHVAILADAQVHAVLLGPQFADIGKALAQEKLTQLPALRLVLSLGFCAEGMTALQALLDCSGETPPAIEISPEHIARIAYTSGTTGQPKGVVYTQERLLARLNAHFLAMEYSLTHEDAMLHVGPLTHAAGVYLFPCFLRGARNIIQDRFDPAAMFASIAQHRVTHLMLVPTMMTRLVEALENGATADLSSLKRIHYGTAPTPTSLIRRAIQVFGPILRQQYGMTEAVQPLTVLYPHQHVGTSESGTDEAIGSCGRPTINVNITVRGADDKPLAQGEIGEIAIAHQGLGAVAFWRRPDLMESSVRKGWFYTGDLGRFDAQGFLHIVGRNKDMIISGGFNVYAKEVEDALLTHPSVSEVAVLGLPDPQWGEAVAAFVVLRAGAQANAAALQAHCSERIAGYKKPRHLEFVNALPRNLAGKIVKTTLRDAYLVRHTPAFS